MNKCCAATASNNIHWWMDRNADYLQKYRELKGVITLSDFKILYAYKNHHETEVLIIYYRDIKKRRMKFITGISYVSYYLVNQVFT